MKKVILEKRDQEGWEEGKRNEAKSDTEVHNSSTESKKPNVEKELNDNPKVT